MSKTTATRINYMHVSVRTATGAPRLFQVKQGDISKRPTCQCKKWIRQGLQSRSRADDTATPGSRRDGSNAGDRPCGGLS